MADTKTIIAAVVTAAAAAAALGGHKIDENSQSNLVEAIADIANGVSVIAAMVTAYLHSRAAAQSDSKVNAANLAASTAIAASATSSDKTTKG